MSYIIVFCVSNQSGVAVPINGNHSDSILRRSEVPSFACLGAEAASASTQLNNHFFREKVSYHRSVHALSAYIGGAAGKPYQAYCNKLTKLLSEGASNLIIGGRARYY